MSNPTQREWIRMRRDAEMDHRTEIRAERENTLREVAKGLKEQTVDPAIIVSTTGLSLAEIAVL